MDANDSESSLAGPSSQLTCDANLKSARLSPPSPSSPFPISNKRSRRSVQKRVVSIPIQKAEGTRVKGVSECAPPSDSWAWRKYGQKPIKGSPYPRGYYRCSSSKGCPARKQVERSRVDPTTLVVTYTCEHNHPWPLPKNHHSSKHVQATVKEEAEADPDPPTQSPPESSPGSGAAAADPDPEESSRFSDLIGEDSTGLMITPDDFWYSDVGSTSSTSPISDTLLYGSIFVGSAEVAPDDCEKIGDFKDDEDDALFAGLGELPEYSTVFRRSYWERQPMAVHTVVHQ